MLFSFNKELLTFSFILPVRCLHNAYDRWLRVYTQADTTYLMFSCQKEKQNIYTCIYIHYGSSHWFIIGTRVLCTFSFATIYYRIFYYVVVSYKRKKEIYIYIYIFVHNIIVILMIKQYLMIKVRGWGKKYIYALCCIDNNIYMY